ncbi:MAG: D-aminoacylase [Patescibacteria group bacterium]
MPFYSIILRNALVFDGAGSAPKKSDIGIEGDRIVFIGDLSQETAAEEVDASGLYVAPGFIDITNHSDTHWTLFDAPLQESLLRQGVTSILGGNCGSSLAPLVKPSDIEDLQKWVDVSEININWQSVRELLAELSNHRVAINFGTLVGHGTLRRAAGIDISREASQEEVEKILYLAHNAFEDGAFGVSTGLGRSHALIADDEEIERVFKEVKKVNGFATHHLQDEGADIISAVSRIVSLSRSSGVKSHLSHFKVLGKKSWPKQKSVLELIGRARSEGVKITADFFPYTSTGSNLYLLLPDWAIVGGRSKIFERLSDDNSKKQIIEALRALTLHYEKIIVASTLKDTGVIGKNIQQVAESAGLSPEEAILQLLVSNDLQVVIFNEAISEENIFELARKDYVAISSDGYGLDMTGSKTNLPHPRSFGAFMRALRVLVKEKGVLSWEEAIRKMTGLPAEIIGFEKRGLIREGFFADIVVFDPETLSDAADYANPRRFSRGVKWVFINGITALADGEPTGKMPGRTLAKF